MIILSLLKNLPVKKEKNIGEETNFYWPQFSSVTQSCPTLSDPMNCSMPSLPVHHQLPEFTQTRPSSRWCHPAISSSVVPFSSCPQLLPAWGSKEIIHLNPHKYEDWVHYRTGPVKSPVQFSSVQSLSCVRLFATPWITAHQASLSITNSQSSLRPTSIQSVMPSSHLILCHPLLLLPPIPPSIKVFSKESTFRMR